VKRGGLLQESPCFLSRKARAQKNGVSGESLAAIISQQGEDWGKKKSLIPENVKRKYLHPCPPFFLSAVFLARQTYGGLVRRLCGGVAQWRTGGPAHQIVNSVGLTPLFFI